MIGSPWLLVAVGAGFASAAMAALWLLQVRIGDASHVDVGWAYEIGALAVLYAILAGGDQSHRALIACLGGVWSARLGTYLLVNRVLGKEEDGRYRALRAKWGASANHRFFVFFQAQAVTVVVFSIPFLLAAINPHPGLEPLEIAGAVLCAAGVAGEATADRQLARWRADPANRGRTCRAGLWRFSRHPNYFFEWLTWVAFALVSAASSWGWIAFGVPALLLYTLFRVTGIPATEAQAVRSRGEDYRRYQRETSAFIPWFPRRAA